MILITRSGSEATRYREVSDVTDHLSSVVVREGQIAETLMKDDYDWISLVVGSEDDTVTLKHRDRG